MDKLQITRLAIGLTAAFLVIAYFITKTFFNKKKITVKFLSRTAVFTALSIILYITPGLKFPVPFFPAFLEIHFDEVPLMIAGFAYGPWSALFAIIVKTLVKLPLTSTLGVGELADLLYSIAFIIPAAIIYKKHRNFKGALIAILVGTIIQIIFSSFFTTFVILDFYMVVMHLPEGAILGMIQKAGINISNLSWPFLYSVGIPFNAFKDVIIVTITMLLYKNIHKLIEKVIK